MIYAASVVGLMIGTIMQLKAEIIEINHKECINYLKDVQNAFQWATIGINVALIIQAIWIAGFLDDITGNDDNYEDVISIYESRKKMVHTMRINMIFSILLNLIELFTRVRIFNFFAYFVRQLNEIVKDALPLGTMLGCIVFAQTLLFWILDMNAIDK